MAIDSKVCVPDHRGLLLAGSIVAYVTPGIRVIERNDSVTSAYSADPVFEANGKLISYLLQRIHDRELALPDFQRDFVWDSRATLLLLQSIMSRFPAGTLLFWKQGAENAGFAARAVNSAPALGGKVPDELVLDGQQRLTALYRALSGTGDDRYFVRLPELLGYDGEVRKVHEVDFDRALASYDLSAKLPFNPLDREWQFENAMFPLAELVNFDEWLDTYARKTGSAEIPEDMVKRRLRALRDAFLVPLRSYGFPVVTLPASTALEAVCNIFETLNRTGKPLGAFDLVTARLYPKGVKMRDLWDEASEKFAVLEDFEIEPYALLQAVSLRARNSAQRADVLTGLAAEDIERHWQPVASGMAAVIDLLQSEYGVLSKRWLPYGMLLVPMAAVWPELRAMRPLDRSEAFDRLSQYFWCSTFMANFDQGANSQAGADYIKLSVWLNDPTATPPEAVANFNLSESTIRQASVRRKALHAGVMSLTIKSGAKDFHSGLKLTLAKVQERRVDSHHVFPKAYLSAGQHSELLLNRALIDSETNKIIGKNAPSLYLGKMRTVHDEDKLVDVMRSHGIELGGGPGMEADDYEAFLLSRLAEVVVMIEAATGKPVVADVSTLTTPS